MKLKNIIKKRRSVRRYQGKAVPYLVLRATDIGLGTCYIGLIAREKAKEILGIPKNYVLPFAITVGYPDEKPKAMPRKSQEDLIIEDL